MIASGRRFLQRLRNFLRPAAAERELARELSAHLDLIADDLQSRGMDTDQARRAARRSFGGLEQAKERQRDARSFLWLEDARRDARYAFRSLAGAPRFTVAAVITLSLGIGASAAMFSFADASAFRLPNVPRPAELIRVFGSTKGTPIGQMSYPDYLDYRDRLTTIRGLVAYDYVPVALSRRQDELPAFVGGWLVSGNYFSVLGVDAAVGRLFRDEDDRPGAEPAVILSQALWARSFGSDPSVVGTRVTLGTYVFTIVGIVPATFRGTELYLHPDLYVPINQWHRIDSTLATNVLHDRSARWLNLLGRRKRATNVDAVNAEVATLARSLEQTYPATNRGHAATVVSERGARARLDSGGYAGAAIMIGIAGLVLLMACANAANLMLARATGRSNEIVIRLALGASRNRLLRLLLAESLMLTATGAFFGVAVATFAVHYMSSVFAANFGVSDLPIALDMRIDARVLLFTLASAAVTGILFGLAPAWQSLRFELASSLKASIGSSRRAAMPLRNVLAATDLTLAVVVLTVAGFAVQHFARQLQTDPGLRTDRVLLMSFNPSLVRHSRTQTTEFFRQMVERTETVPGVAAAGLVQFIPLGVNGPDSSPIVVDRYRMPEEEEAVWVTSNVVDGGYWRVVRTPIVRGRAFDDRDTTSSPGVAIVNETMAKRFWPDGDALGQTFHLQKRGGPLLQVVGIAKDGKYGTLSEPQQPCLFMPPSQRFRPLMTLVVLANGDPATLVTPIRRQAQALGGNVPLFDVRPFDDLYRSRALMPARLTAAILTSLGMLALVLAVVGLYGVVSLLATLRRREIGIRVAVGAQRADIVALIVRQGLPTIGSGVVIGLVAAFFVTPAIAVPFDFVPRDMRMLGFVATLMVAIALGASLVPALRATIVAPAAVLRDE